MAPTRSADRSDDPVTRALLAALPRRLGRDPAHVCVAFSGGMDSTVLLHALVRLQSREATGRSDAAAPEWTISAHHVHHGLSPNADAWANHCRTVCAAWAVPLCVTHVNVAQDGSTGIEAAARVARYAALSAQVCDHIALAHHARDQAETVLLQMLRGAGPKGLAAMPTKSDDGGRYLRPLLGLSHRVLADYAVHHRLRWIDDESNGDPRFARNRLRHAVWPALTAAFPATEPTLARAARWQADAAQLLDDLAEVDLAPARDGDGLRPSVLRKLAPHRRANLLRYWMQQRGLEMPPARRLDDWLRQLDSQRDNQNMTLSLGPSRPSLRCYRDVLYIVPHRASWAPVSWRGVLPAQVDLGAAGCVSFVPSDDADALRPPRAGEIWTLRPRREGDRIALSQRSGHVSLKNVMQNAAVPPWLRDVWPLLICDNEVVAVAGVATAFAYTVRPVRGVPAVDVSAPEGCGVRLQWKPAWR